MEERTPKPVIWGWVLTGGVLLFGGVLGFIPTCDSAGDCQSKFAAFWSAPPNEIGDTLAGFAGALAFIWIIVTVMLQSKELKAQREELRLTRSEMEEQRKATQDMARSMKTQLELLQDERKLRNQDQAAELLRALLVSLKGSIRRASEVRHWQKNVREGTHENGSLRTKIVARTVAPFDYNDRLDGRPLIAIPTMQLEEFLSKMDTDEAWLLNQAKSDQRSRFSDIAVVIKEIERLRTSLSVAELKKLEDLELHRFDALIADLLRRDLWSDQCGQEIKEAPQ